MSLRRWVLLYCVGLGLSCVVPPNSVAEQCDNVVDDDGNGKADCDDASCQGEQICLKREQPPYLGMCAKCGQSCTRQSECLASSYGVDEPLPQCTQNRCEALREGIRIRFEVDTAAWFGVNVKLGTLNTRFVSKRALNGTALGCDALQTLASSTLEADASQIERSGGLNLLAYDVTPISASAGDVLVQPFLPVSTGADFIIWTEIWAGAPDSNTKLPTGKRMGFGCFESGPAVAPILTEHHWNGAAPEPTSRTIRVAMPAPK